MEHAVPASVEEVMTVNPETTLDPNTAEYVLPAPPRAAGEVVVVAPRVDLGRRADLLGRHVVRRAHDDRGRRELLRVVFDLGDAEIEHLEHDAAARLTRHEQVRGLEIAVHDAERVRLGEGEAGVEDGLHGVVGGERPAGLEHALEVLSFEVLHDHEGLAGVERADVEHPGDVLALDDRRRARLTLEPLGDIRVGRDLAAQELERDGLIEHEVRGGEHHAHAAFPELSLEPVLAP